MNLNYESLKPKQVKTLHKAFLKGDKEAGFKLVQSVVPLVLGLAKKRSPILLKRMGLEDFCQEMYLFIYERLETFDPKKGTITTWAGWELRHFTSDKFRRYANLVKIPAHVFYKNKEYVEPAVFNDPDFEFFHSREDEPLQLLIATESYEKLVKSAAEVRDQLMKVAPETHKETIRLRYLEGKTYIEISKAVGITRQGIELRCKAVKGRLVQHYRMLKKGAINEDGT